MHPITNNLSDKELQIRYRDFEKEALPHLDAVFNFALRMTGDEDDADDLVQETFMKSGKKLTQEVTKRLRTP